MSTIDRGGEKARQRSLELLIPEGGVLETRAREAAELACAMRGPLRGAGQVAPSEARLAFEREGHTQAGAALEDLLVHHLRAVHRGSSFLHLPSARRQVQAAWDELSNLRDSFEQLPGVPFPGESPLAVAGRLLEGLEALEWDAGLLKLWRARLLQVDPLARGGESAFREALADTPASGPGSRTYVELVLGLAECLLDRGALREAHEALSEELRFASRATHARWSRLRSWSALLSGKAAPDGCALAEAGAMELPRAMLEMRADWSAALPFLAGREMQTDHGSQNEWICPARSADSFSRHSVGAVVFAVFALRQGGVVTPLHVDVAPGLRGRVDVWVREREDACSLRSACEHRMVVEARMQRSHAERLPSCLSSEAKSLALTPLLDAEGEVAGWVHLEWEHHLIPETERLEAAARGWRARAQRPVPGNASAAGPFSDRVSEPAPCAWSTPGAGERLQRTQPDPGRSLSAALFKRCLVALGIKLSQRRWWAFVQDADETQFVASGGQSLDDALQYPGGARGLDRCRASSGAVCFNQPEPGLSLHKGSASGVVLPFMVQGRLVGMLAIESTRRRDFRSTEVERLAAVVAEFALPLELSRFRSWHLERFGNDLYFDCSRAAIRDLACQVNDAARSRAVVVLAGPAGSGKRMLARWLHWSRGQSGEGLCLLHAGHDFPEGTQAEQFAARLQRPHGSVVLDALPSLAPHLQAELLRLLEASASSGAADWRSRLIVTTPNALALDAEEGRLRPELAARLERLQLFVPGLIDRREDLPGLVEFLARRFAAEEGSREPRFTDEAQALLWRQAWRGNFRDLEGFVFKLSFLHAGEEVGAQAVRAIARRFKFPLLEKLPSRRPRRRDLLQALRTTIKNTGSFNKRRAALYLGWDPDTLFARLNDQQLDSTALLAEPQGWGD